MRRRASTLLVCLAAIAATAAGPTTAPVAAGERLRAELEQSYARVVAAAGDPRTIEAYERTNKGWADLVRPLTGRQCDDLIEYATTARFGDGDFDDRLRRFVFSRAVNDGNPDVLKPLLANVWLDAVDGRYTEWLLERKTGRAVEILAAAYAATPSRDQADRLAAVFRRAFPQLDGRHLTDRGYVAKCEAFWQAHQPTPDRRRQPTPIRLNDNYQRPAVLDVQNGVQLQRDGDQRPAPPDPDAGMLFLE